MTGPGLPAYGAVYGYYDNNGNKADLVSTLDFRSDESTTLLRNTRAYDSQRDLVDYIDNVWWPDGSPATLSKYDYTNDDLGRRSQVDYSGVAFGSPGTPLPQSFGYYDRNELHTSTRGAVNWTYGYDPIGNRSSYVTNADDPNTPVSTTYVGGELNQYDRVDVNAAAKLRQGLRYDADGNLAEYFVAADMNCDGALNFGDINPFWQALSNPSAWHAAYPNCDILNGDINGDGTVGFGDITPFTMLLSGGDGAHGLRTEFTWDGENRLMRVLSPPGPMHIGQQKIEFLYDYLGRRIELSVYEVPDEQPLRWNLLKRRRFAWSGWRMLVEADGGNNPIRRYTWGLDLAGNGDWLAAGGGVPVPISTAGGVGGLLAMQDAQGTPWDPNDDLKYVYLYDGNGNVGQLVDWSHDPNDPAGAIVAKYEYDPYGNRTNYDPNAPEYDQPFRFSTKYYDAETGLSYFGYRYYNAGLGRWINRDPIGELGGANLYAYIGNDPVDHVDYLGRMAALCQVPPCGQTKHCPKTGNGSQTQPTTGPVTQPPEPHEREVPPFPPDVCDNYSCGPNSHSVKRGESNNGYECGCDRDTGYECPASTVYNDSTGYCDPEPPAPVRPRQPVGPNEQGCPEQAPGNQPNDGWCKQGSTTFHSPAASCYRGHGANGGKQCCYNRGGGLIPDDQPGAGTDDFVGPAVGENPDGSCDYGTQQVICHVILDVIPHIWCEYLTERTP